MYENSIKTMKLYENCMKKNNENYMKMYKSILKMYEII